jgi:hypothetical protein
MATTIIPVISLGQCSATPGARAALESNGQNAIMFLRRHAAGDWGELSDDDKGANMDALIPNEDGECARVLSAYHLRDETKIWIITEWDRSRTTVLLPSEY